MATFKSLRRDITGAMPGAKSAIGGRSAEGAGACVIVQEEEHHRGPFLTPPVRDSLRDFIRSTRNRFRQQLLEGDDNGALTTYTTCPRDSKVDLESDAFAMARRGREKLDARLAAVRFLKKCGLSEDLVRLDRCMFNYPEKTDADMAVLGAIRSAPN